MIALPRATWLWVGNVTLTVYSAMIGDRHVELRPGTWVHVVHDDGCTTDDVFRTVVGFSRYGYNDFFQDLRHENAAL